MTQPLSALERRVYEYLVDFLTANTYQPSIREIGREFGIKSTKTVSDLLHGLERKGFIERDPARSRGVRILGLAATTQLRPVPVYTGASDGDGVAAPDVGSRAGFLTVERRLAPGETTFAVRAPDDTLRGHGILDGDYVLVDPAGAPQDGDVVAVRRDGRTVLELFQAARERVAPAGTATEQERAIDVKDDGRRPLLGVVCGVVRALRADELHSSNGVRDGNGGHRENGHAADAVDEPVGSQARAPRLGGVHSYATPQAAASSA